MFKHYFEQVHGIEIWPIISLIIFFVFFVCLILWVIKADKKYLSIMESLPLDNDDSEDTTKFTVNKKMVALVLLSIVTIRPSMAGTQAMSNNDVMIHGLLIFLLAVAVFSLLLAMYVLHTLTKMVDDQIKQKQGVEGKNVKKEPSIWTKLDQMLNDSVPMEQEASIVLDHEYDGIRELDNHLPPWWKYMAYMTIVFSVIYIFVYHVSESMPLQITEYENEIAAAELAKANVVQAPGMVIDESSLVFDNDPAVIASGKKVYEMQCVACHKTDGAGGIGPNLADDYWLHGGSITDVFKTVRYGVPDKGMISWEGVLSLAKINDVTMYIRTLKGTTPTGAKGPQGELYAGE